MNRRAIRAELEAEVARTVDDVMARYKAATSYSVHVSLPEPDEVRVDVDVVRLEPIEDEVHRLDLLELD